jgi:hypothetical protein
LARSAPSWNEKKPSSFGYGATEVDVSSTDNGRAGIVLLGRITGALFVLLIVIFGFGAMKDEAPIIPPQSEGSVR